RQRRQGRVVQRDEARPPVGPAQRLAISVESVAVEAPADNFLPGHVKFLSVRGSADAASPHGPAPARPRRRVTDVTLAKLLAFLSLLSCEPAPLRQGSR